jgi:hypothetical protein
MPGFKALLRGVGLLPQFVTENGVPPRWRHTRSVGQSIAGRAPGGQVQVAGSSMMGDGV